MAGTSGMMVSERHTQRENVRVNGMDSSYTFAPGVADERLSRCHD